MWKKMLMAGTVIAGCMVVMADFQGDIATIKKLCQEQKHDEAIKAFLELGAKSVDAQQWQAVTEAALCTMQHKKNASEALALTEQIKSEPYKKVARLKILKFSSPQQVVDEFKGEDFSKWPEPEIGLAYLERGRAYLSLKNGTEAEKDLLNAVKMYKVGQFQKWEAMQLLGDTYWKVMNDETKAEDSYRDCIDGFSGGWPAFIARINLSEMLRKQKKYDEALQCLQSGTATESPFWTAEIKEGVAKVYIDQGKKAEAVAIAEEVLKMPGITDQQKRKFEKILTDLKK